MGVATLLTGTSVVVFQAKGGQPAQYIVIDLGTLGGEYSFPYAINDSGTVAGGAATSTQTDFLSQTAFLWNALWNGGKLINLGTLDGPACPDCNSEGAAASANGTVAVISERAAVDVNGEDVCAFGTHRQCVAAVWKAGTLRALEMLPGGHNSQVFYANNGGAMAGFSETGEADPNCAAPFQQFRFQAVRWTRNGDVSPLRLLPGDTVSYAMAMNDVGQAVGGSGICSSVIPPPLPPRAPHAVFWDVDGTPVDLGTPPGGIGNNNAAGINNRGDVVENSIMADGTFHAFIWNRSERVLHDLGTYPPDAVTTVTPCCNVINDSRQIVGFSVDSSGNARTLLWQNGVPVDVNTLVPADSPWYAMVPAGINQAGEITTVALNMQTSEVHAVVLLPRVGIGPEARGAVKPPHVPDAVRRRLLPKGL
jgi:probable HAF family extracellular repeat protein